MQIRKGVDMESWSLLISLTIIVLLINKKKSVAVAILTGSIVFSILNQLGLREVSKITWTAITSPITVNLVFVIILIGVLGKVMKDLGLLDQMVKSLTSLISDMRWIMLLIPSLIGLLPVPGGAALSAPLVDATGDKLRLNTEEKAAANLFFRHVWYMIFPLYSSLILAASMIDRSVYDFIKLQLGPTLFAVGVGFWWFFRKYKKEGPNTLEGITQQEPVSNIAGKLEVWKSLTVSLLPIGAVIILAIFFGVDFITSLLIGILLALGSNIKIEGADNDVTLVDWLKVFGERAKTLIWRGISWSLAAAITAIMIYQQLVQEVGTVAKLSETMTELGIPLFLLAIIIPFFAGIVTGSNLAVIATTFMLFVPLVPTESALAYLSMVYVFGVVGYIVSPIHLCLVVTNEYYQCNTVKVLQKLVV
ncbi:MAG: DUF401 family protein, partial [Bacillota bacterium]|nr:DUF401 family protein [Bacillota bacterium]